MAFAIMTFLIVALGFGFIGRLPIGSGLKFASNMFGFIFGVLTGIAAFIWLARCVFFGF